MKVYVFGAGQVAQTFAALMEACGYRVDGYLVDRGFEPDGADRPLFRLDELTQPCRFTLGMSYQGLNAPRAAKFKQLCEMGHEPLTFVDSSAKVSPRAKIGRGSFIMERNVIQPYVEIGENCILWSGNHIGHHSRIANHVFIASHVVVSGAVEIGDRCFIGVNATVRDNVKIGEACVIGMGARITKDCEPDGLYAEAGTARASIPASKLKRI